MELKLKDVAVLFGAPEKTVLKWIKDRNLPAHKIRNQYLFSKSEISEWVLKNNIAVTKKILDLSNSQSPASLSELLKRGGIHKNITGGTISEVLKNSVKFMKIPGEITKDILLDSLLKREELMSTAVGNGIALPHPRNPIITEARHERVSLCFLTEGIDYSALDGIPVIIIFIILSSNASRHLNILSRISYLCRDSGFLSILKNGAESDEIMKYVQNREQEWDKR